MSRKERTLVPSFTALCTALVVGTPSRSEAGSCELTAAAAQERAQQVRILLQRNESQLIAERNTIRLLERRTEDMAQAVAVGRMAFATSLAAGTVLAAGVTASCAGAAMSASVDFASLIGRVFAGGGAFATAPLTAGMAYGTYRTVLSAGNTQVNSESGAFASAQEREDDAKLYLDLIREPGSAPNASVRTAFEARRYDPVRSFLNTENCAGAELCSPIPRDFSEQLKLIQRTHREAAVRFERENSDWWPEVISNHEARRIALVELPFHQGVLEHLSQTQAYFRVLKDRLQRCED